MEQLFNLLVMRAHEVAPHLIHAAWLGVAVIALPALFLRFSRWGNAATRYVLCWGLLLAVVALPAMIGIAGQLTDILTSRQSEQPAVYSPSHTADASTPVHWQTQANQPVTLDKHKTFAVSPDFVGAGPVVTPLTPTPRSMLASQPTIESSETGFDYGLLLGLVPGLLLAACLLISILLMLRVLLSLGYLGITLIRSKAAPEPLQQRAAYWADRLECPRPISIRMTDALRSPAATGYFKGIILLPTEMLEDFSPCDIDAVIIHEMSHLKRFDDWARLAEHLFAAFFFYLPAVHWLIRQIDLHREIACDDMVVATTGRPAEYARTLTRLAEYSSPNPRAALAPGAMITKKQIFARFSMILSSGRKRDNRLASRTLTTVFVTLLAALLFVGQQLPALTLPGSAVTFSDVSNAIFGTDETPGESDTSTDIDTEPEPAATAEAPSVRFSDPSPQTLPDNRVRVVNRSVNRVRNVDAPAVAFEAAPIGLSAEDIDGLASLAEASAELGLLAADAGPIAEAVEGAVRGLEQSLRGISDWEGTVSDINDDRGYFEYRDGRESMRIEWDGELTFTDDMLGIKAIEPGGYFELEGRERRDRVRVLIESDRSGSMEYLYYRDGRLAEYDADAKEWFETSLTKMIRMSGLGAEQRVALIREKSGVNGVLDEIEEIPNGYARGLYYTALLDGTRLSDDERNDVFMHATRWLDSDYQIAEFLIRAAEDDLITEAMMPDIVKAMEGMDSNYEIRRVLTAIGVESSDDPKVLIEVLKIADRMDSDYERAELLIEIAPKVSGDDALLDAYVTAVTDIDSDYETRRVLQALHFDHDVDPKLAARIMPIISEMDSDYEKVELLIEMAHAAESDEDLIAMYVDVAASIDSDYEMRRALQQISYLSSANDSTLLKVLYLARDLQSDYERAEFLKELAGLSHRSNEMRAAYLDAALRISSDYEKVRVLEELVETGEDDVAFLGEMLEVVAAVHSDFEKANLLRRMSPLCARHAELETPFVEAIESIDGDYERDKLYRAFYRDLKQLQ